MCLAAIGIAAGAAAGTGTAASLGLSIVSGVIGATSAITGMVNAYQQNQFAQAQARTQTLAAQRQVQLQRQATMLQHVGQVKAYNQAQKTYQRQVTLNSDAANRVYMSEQIRLNEIAQKMAFRQQELYAKQIGNVGAVLSAGRTGQSVGLLTLDADRRAGFAAAQDEATMRSATAAAGIGMLSASQEQTSANNRAYSALPAPVQAPQFDPWPVGVGGKKDLGIPAYRWS